LRSFLLVSLKHFLADEKRHAMAVKRGKGQPLIPLEELRTGADADIEPSDPRTAERIYERRWASTLLEHVFDRLKDDYQTAGNATLFDWLKQLLPDEPGTPSPADIAAKLGMTENAVRQAYHRFRQRYQSLLREEIAHTVATPDDVEDELRNLISVLRA
jgi:RNA polymerase sigma-70 factor (ECF subfamily)